MRKLISLRDWSESRVLRIEGKQFGNSVVCYLKFSRKDTKIEPMIYEFASRNLDFPAPSAKPVKLEEEDWLLLHEAEGILLADMDEKDILSAYFSAARGLAIFHSHSIDAGWIDQLAFLTYLNEELRFIPSIVLGEIRSRIMQGNYSGIDLDLLDFVEIISKKNWWGIVREFSRFPDNMIHGDCHLGNLFIKPDGGINLIDWATATIAPGLMDLVTLADVSQRMRVPVISESEMLNTYMSHLSIPDCAKYGNVFRAWTICRAVRAYMEIVWLQSMEEDYGDRIQRELILLSEHLL